MPRTKKPKRMTKCVLLFDTETTGLFPKDNSTDLSKFPHIIQLSYILYDVDSYTTVEVFNHYVKLDESVPISAEVSQLTGITREKCDTEGLPIEYCIRAFRSAYNRAELVVAHNLSFDLKMIHCEMKRLIKQKLYNCISAEEKEDVLGYINLFKMDKPTYCTMVKGVDICRIPVKDSATRMKYPKLAELYKTLFTEDTIPTSLHNSMTDVLVCLRCYVQLSGVGEISSTKFSSMLRANQVV